MDSCYIETCSSSSVMRNLDLRHCGKIPQNTRREKASKMLDFLSTTEEKETSKLEALGVILG